MLSEGVAGSSSTADADDDGRSTRRWMIDG